MLTILTGCKTSGTEGELKLEPIPGEIKTCINKLVPRPLDGPMTKARVVALIAALKKSEKAKTQCGQRLIKLYEAQSK